MANHANHESIKPNRHHGLTVQETVATVVFEPLTAARKSGTLQDDIGAFVVVY